MNSTRSATVYTVLTNCRESGRLARLPVAPVARPVQKQCSAVLAVVGDGRGGDDVLRGAAHCGLTDAGWEQQLSCVYTRTGGFRLRCGLLVATIDVVALLSYGQLITWEPTGYPLEAAHWERSACW
eukprot:COSAG02_NODE_834_length_16653_cov_9.111977_10_plen_126_part_00